MRRRGGLQGTLLRASLVGLGTVFVAAVSHPQIGDLIEVPRPTLEQLEDYVQEQFDAERSRLDALIADDAAADVLGEAFGRMGQLYYIHDFGPAAEACFLNASRLLPNDFRWAYLLGAHYPSTGDLDSAARFLQQAVDFQPDDVPARIRLGRVELDRQNLDVAEQSFAAASELDPASAAAQYGLGQVAFQRGDFNAAIDRFERALELQPSATLIHYQLGLAYRELGDLDQALAEMKKNSRGEVAMRDPLIESLYLLVRSAKLYFNTGIDLLNDGKIEEGITQLRKAIETEPDMLLAHHNLAAALVLAGRRDEGIAEYRRTLEIEPDYRNAHYNLGMALVEAGRVEEAAHHLQRAHELDPEDLMAHLEWATALSKIGQPERAIQELEALLVLDSENPRALLNLGTVLNQLGRHEAAMQPLTRLVELRGEFDEQAAGFEQMGGALRALGRLEPAVESYRQALARDPDLLAAHLALAGIHGQRGEFAAAADQFTAAIRLAPDDPGPHFGRALALILGEDLVAARSALESSLASHPQSIPLAHLLARLLATAPDAGVRNGPRSLQLAERVFSQQQNLDHAETLAMALAEVGRFADAVDLQSQVVTRARGAGNQVPPAMQARLELYQQGLPCRAPWRQ